MVLYVFHLMDQYVTPLIQQKLKPYPKHVQFVNHAEQIGMDSVKLT
jgi:hypothetical protein